ncbi:MAG: hypothetical protein J2P50_01390 [Hyphomicrobiaceae bacterium]|nr:hypothetical protein [Hyphomicrobiaceae bacterium]
MKDASLSAAGFDEISSVFASVALLAPPLPTWVLAKRRFPAATETANQAIG